MLMDAASGCGRERGKARARMTTTAASRPRRKKQNRAETSEAIRRSIFFAAASVVGRYGYADASVSRITAKANVAHGTFYNYFESRQDLFEQLLPALGEILLATVTERVTAFTDPVAREEARLLAWFEFLKAHPEFYRILNEAEVFVPEIYRKHVERFGAGFLRSLQRAKARGALHDFTDDELEPIAYILLASRAYLTFRYARNGGKALPLETVTSAYMKLLQHGLFAASPLQSPRRRKVRRA